MSSTTQPSTSGDSSRLRFATPIRGGKGAEAYLQQLIRLGATQQEVDAARRASASRSRRLRSA